MGGDAVLMMKQAYHAQGKCRHMLTKETNCCTGSRTVLVHVSMLHNEQKVGQCVKTSCTRDEVI